ncbi:glycosyltransferase family 9 protein [Pedococcus sp. 5OH_020]|uniref:glycosyltransferase family 9 protein n=1 Tax=Pedococcus sp. 5OH_020 TaxID=2989814 RepID=UPI0022E9F317|nr:glycosyltransferase family 9 protein [Pedococcus sp. 5OH_020]
MTSRGVIEDVNRVVALRANAIGDFLMVLPALEAVRRTYPRAHVTVVGDAWLPGLLDGRPGPWDRCVVAPPYPGLRGLPADAAPGPEVGSFLLEHRACRYDVALQLHGGGGTSNHLVGQLGARVSVGARAPGAPPLDRWTPYLPHRHEVLRWLDVVDLVGAGQSLEVRDLVPRLTVTAQDLVESRSAHPGDDQPFVALHVGARDPRRRWRPERFADVARRLLASGLDVVLVGGNEDRELSHDVAARLAGVRTPGGGRCHDLSARLTLGGTLGTLARAAVFVGNDSGPRHLATAAGTPTVAVYWVGNVMTFGPLVGAADRALVSFQTSCPVCGQEQVGRRCEHDVSFLDPVTADEVYAGLQDALWWSQVAASTTGCG